jgi:hypothetical protein
MLRPDRRDLQSRDSLLQRIQGEFAEMPCLRLTAPQARRLFHLRPDICDRVLTRLVETRTLVRGTDGRYGLAGSQIAAEQRYAFSAE